MGLDMYLYVKKHECIGHWDKEKEEMAKTFYPEELKVLADGIYRRNFLSKSSKYQVGYWRKANAIHKWFVDNCGEGIDECQEIYVSVKDLIELEKVVDKVLKNHDLAEELLPTQDGFFFGETEYDEWYFNDLLYTKILLENLFVFLENNEKYEVIYQASW